MRIPYRKINKALEKEFGKGFVQLKKGRGTHTLRFRDDNVPNSVMNKALAMVDSYVPTAWGEPVVRK